MTGKNISYFALYFKLVISSYIPNALELESALCHFEKSSLYTGPLHHKHPVANTAMLPISADALPLRPTPTRVQPQPSSQPLFRSPRFSGFSTPIMESPFLTSCYPFSLPFFQCWAITRQTPALPYSHFFYLWGKLSNK